MDNTSISFYLKVYRIHVFVDSLRRLGSPARICFMISNDGRNLMIRPYSKKDFRSHSVPGKVYKGERGLEISSYMLCNLIADMYHWDTDCSYRVPGTVFPQKGYVIFDLTKATAI